MCMILFNSWIDFVFTDVPEKAFLVMSGRK